MVALGAGCHEVKHTGSARVNGRGPIGMRHRMRVNAWGEREADAHVEHARAVWRQRSEHQWSLNLDALGSFGVNVGTLTAAARPPARTDLYSGPSARRVTSGQALMTRRRLR